MSKVSSESTTCMSSSTTALNAAEVLPWLNSRHNLWRVIIGPSAAFPMTLALFFIHCQGENPPFGSLTRRLVHPLRGFFNFQPMDHENRKSKRKGDRYSAHTSLIVAAVKRLLPVGLRFCSPDDQSLIALAKSHLHQVEHEWRSCSLKSSPKHCALHQTARESQANLKHIKNA